MNDELKRRLLTLGHAINPLLQLAVDAESHALPGTTRDGLLKLRYRLTQMQTWLAAQVAK